MRVRLSLPAYVPQGVPSMFDGAEAQIVGQPGAGNLVVRITSVPSPVFLAHPDLKLPVSYLVSAREVERI